MSYLQCPSCGHKALSVATRCPHCGLAFETQLFRHPASDSKPSRIRLGPLIAGAVVIVLVANAVWRKLSVTPPVHPPASAIVSAPPTQPQPPAKPHPAKSDSLRAVSAPQPQSPRKSQPPASDSTRATEPNLTAEPVGTVEAQRRYASTWMNVRSHRSKTAPVIRILRPGEVVLVDLLEQGWYRVVIDQQAMGYVDRRYLEESPPSGQP